MTTALIAIPLCIMLFFPKTAAAKWLHKHLVVGLIDAAARFERRQFIYFILMIMMMHSLLPLMSLEMATLIIADLSLYYDAVITAYLAAFAARAKSVWWAIKSRVAAIFRCRRPAARHRRDVASKPPRKPAANDDPDPAHETKIATVGLAA